MKKLTEYIKKRENKWNKKIVQDLSKEELGEIIKPSFRAKQIYNWIYHKYADSFDEMKNLPKEMREKLDEELYDCAFKNGYGARLKRRQSQISF